MVYSKVCIPSVDLLQKMAQLLFNVIISNRTFNNIIADFIILPRVENGENTIYKGFLIRNENAALKLLELST